MLLKEILAAAALAAFVGCAITAINAWLHHLDDGLDDWSEGEW